MQNITNHRAQDYGPVVWSPVIDLPLRGWSAWF
jgi:hypothetical protein